VLIPPRVHDPVVAPQQYAVVLVSEEQLNELMHRPPMRHVNRSSALDVQMRRQTLKRRTAAAAVFLLVLAGALVWFLAPQPAMASMFPWSGSPKVSTVSTGASFSVTFASLDSGDGAGLAAAHVRGFGLPAFTRRSPGKRQVYQAMVGPYASLDEAERAQSRLGRMGYRGARLFVDESLRGASQADVSVDLGQQNVAVLLVGAPDRLSFVLELPSEPRQVTTRRSPESTLDVDVSPMPSAIRPQQWSVPEGVHLLHMAAIEGLSAPGGGQFLRARLTLPEFAKANVRTEDRRVYVDLTWPVVEEDVRAPRRPAPEAPGGGDRGSGIGDRGPRIGDQGSAIGRQEEQYREAIAPVHQRITEVRPFLLSAAQSGTVEVLTALDQTLAELESSLAAMRVPASAAGQHQLLLSATRAARAGLEPGFSGDRVAHQQQALAMFDGAMAPPATPVPH